MMVAEYQLQLQDKKVLQDKLQELINMPLLEDDEKIIRFSDYGIDTMDTECES